MEAGDLYISKRLPVEAHSMLYDQFNALINMTPFVLKYIVYAYPDIENVIQFEVVNEDFIEKVGGDREETMDVICLMREKNLDITNIDDYEKLTREDNGSNTDNIG